MKKVEKITFTGCNSFNHGEEMKKELMDYLEIFGMVTLGCSLFVTFGIVAIILFTSFWLGTLAFFGMVQLLTLLCYYTKKKDSDIFDDHASA